MPPPVTPEQSAEKVLENKQILSYQDFFILCISGPVLAFATMAMTTYFPNILPVKYVFDTVFSLQGMVALRFMLKRDPNLNSDVSELTGGRANTYVIKILVVAATTVGSSILLVLPLYAIFKFPL
ncbi:MAG: hypothetical protein Q8P17_04015 [bacterium]|nr:hypothetical protein [bacterium]